MTNSEKKHQLTGSGLSIGSKPKRLLTSKTLLRRTGAGGHQGSKKAFKGGPGITMLERLEQEEKDEEGEGDSWEKKG